MIEEWRIIADHPKYEVSETGRIRRISPGRSTRVGRELKPQKSSKGYLIVHLGASARVHRLVCRAFHGPAPADKPMVRHLDGNPANNHFSNLAWGTHAENMKDRDAHGRTVSPPRAARREWTHCHRGHEFTPENTYLQSGRRRCRRCDCERYHARREMAAFA